MIRLLAILLPILIVGSALRAQGPARSDSGIALPIRAACKGYSVAIMPWPDISVRANTDRGRSQGKSADASPRLLSVSGNILYDVNYRSRLDTPYAENEVYQHTLQTRLDFVYKEQYPFRLYLTTHFSNSPFFRNYTDLNLRYTQADFARMTKMRLLNVVENYLAARTKKLDSLLQLINSKRANLEALDRSLRQIDLSQKIVEQRERDFLRARAPQPQQDTLLNIDRLTIPWSWQEKYKFSGANASKNADDSAGSTSKAEAELSKAKTKWEKGRHDRDSLEEKLQEIKRTYDSLMALRQLAQDKGKSQVENAKDAVSLETALHELGISDTVLPKGYKTLLALQSLSIGRSVANYSELSVKDISIMGIQVEYNPHFYYAAAVGKVDYRFRDYIVPNGTSSGQYLALVRAGVGSRNGNHLIFTYYTGKRQFFTSTIAVGPGLTVPEYKLAGFTVEGQFQLDKNLTLVGEVAKSTLPYYSTDSLQRQKWLHDVTRFSNRTNEAYSVRLNGWFPQTQTRFTAMLGRLGANFQSFSTFTTGTARTRWMLRLEQPFFAKKLTVISSVQQNAYTNPFASTAYNSSSVLTSLQATLRIKKWPVVSVGYYPSYQLTKVGNNSFGESRYFTLMGNASYAYRFHAMVLTSYLLYSRFYNASADSGFVYYNAENWYLSEQLMAGPLTVSLGGSVSKTPEYTLYTLESSAEFAICRWISIGAGLKRIKQTVFNSLRWGYNGNLTLHIPKVGDIQCLLDKGYLPGMNKTLMENKVGRLTYFKTF